MISEDEAGITKDNAYEILSAEENLEIVKAFALVTKEFRDEYERVSLSNTDELDTVLEDQDEEGPTEWLGRKVAPSTKLWNKVSILECSKFRQLNEPVANGERKLARDAVIGVLRI